MFVYEIRLIDGTVLCNQGFKTFYDAECEMLEIHDNSDIGVDFEIVKEIKE